MDSKTPVPPLAGLSARLRIASPWMGLALLVVTVLRSLWGPLPKGHDTLLHFYRIAEINALWRQGIFFSRWAPDLMLGYGYPLFHFYPPLSAYLLTLTYWLVGQNAPLAMSIVFACSLVLSGLGMFLLARQLYGPLGGLFAASAYLLSPYLLYQTFERASLSNALAMAFFPLAAWLLVRVAQTPTWRRVAGAALVLAAVLLSHVAASLLFVAPVAVLGLVAAWRAGGQGRALWLRLGAVGAALAGGLALSAFFWLPAAFLFSHRAIPPWNCPARSARLGFHLFLVGFLVLFLELACIRWFAVYVVFLQFFTNVALIASFLGMSCGCLAARSNRDWLGYFPLHGARGDRRGPLDLCRLSSMARLGDRRGPSGLAPGGLLRHRIPQSGRRHLRRADRAGCGCLLHPDRFDVRGLGPGAGAELRRLSQSGRRLQPEHWRQPRGHHRFFGALDAPGPRRRSGSSLSSSVWATCCIRPEA